MWDYVDDEDPTLEKKLEDYIEALGRMAFMMTNRISNFLDVRGKDNIISNFILVGNFNVKKLPMQLFRTELYLKYGLFIVYVRSRPSYHSHAKRTLRRSDCICSANFCFSYPFGGLNNPILSETGNSAPFDISGMCQLS